MIPKEVRAVAASASVSDLPPSIAALSVELSAGQVSGAGMTSLVYLHACAPGAPSDAIGGRPGAWWAACRAPSLPASVRTEQVDDWVLASIASAPADVFAAAAPGRMRPTMVRDFDRNADALDARAISIIREILQDALSKLIRRLGLEVTSAVRGKELTAQLKQIPVDEVYDFARSNEVRPGRTILAVTAIEVLREIERAAEIVRERVEAALAELDAEARRLIGETFGVGVDEEDDDRIAVAAQEAVNQFMAIANRRLAPDQPTLSEEDVELGEGSSSSVGVGTATAILLAATAAGAFRSVSGLIDDGSQVTAPTVARRPSLLRTAQDRLVEAGRRLTGARDDFELRRNETAQELTGIRGLLDRIRRRIEETRRQTQLGDQARNSRLLLEAERRALLEEEERLRSVLRALRSEERETIEAIRAELGLNGQSADLATALGEGRIRIVEETSWAHGKYGSPVNPFPPHENLDREVFGTEEYIRKIGEPQVRVLKDGTERVTQPFAGVWFPGDHFGCTCGFTVITTLEVVPL